MVRLLCHLAGVLFADFKPYRVVDFPREPLIDMVRPGKRWLAFFPVVRFVEHIPAMLVFGFALVMARGCGAGARDIRGQEKTCSECSVHPGGGESIAPSTQAARVTQGRN